MMLGFNIQMWGYRFGYTIAQIELATADAPFVNYKKDKDKKEKFRKADSLAVLEAHKRWEDRRKLGKKRFSADMFEQPKND